MSHQSCIVGDLNAFLDACDSKFAGNCLWFYALIGGLVAIAGHILVTAMTLADQRRLPSGWTMLATLVQWFVFLFFGCVAARALDAHSKVGALYDGLSGPALLWMLAKEAARFFALVRDNKA